MKHIGHNDTSSRPRIDLTGNSAIFVINRYMRSYDMVFAKPQLEYSFSRGRGKQAKLTTVKNKIIHFYFIYKICEKGEFFCFKLNQMLQQQNIK